MEHKSSNFRHFNCLSVSVVLHSLIIVGLGIASSMMLLKKGDGQGEGKPIEVAVVSETAPAVEVAPAPVVELPAPAAAPAPAAVVTKPVEKKIIAVKKPAQKKSEPKIEQTLQPQPAVEVAETMNEEAAVVADSDSQTLPEKEEVIEEKPEEIKEEVAPVAAAAVAEEVVAEKSVEQKADVAPVTEKTSEAATTEKIADTGKSETAGGQKGTAEQAAPIATAAAPQNFLNLKQASGNKPPQYTREMRFNKAEGRGQLQYYVTKSGTVSQLKVTQSSGNPELDRAAAESFAKYKFVPGQEGYTVHNFEFTLKGPAEADAGRLRTTYK